MACLNTARRSEEVVSATQAQAGTAEILSWPAHALAQRAERLREQWEARFNAGLDADPFAAGGPWSAEA